MRGRNFGLAGLVAGVIGASAAGSLHKTIFDIDVKSKGKIFRRPTLYESTIVVNSFVDLDSGAPRMIEGETWYAKSRKLHPDLDRKLENARFGADRTESDIAIVYDGENAWIIPENRAVIARCGIMAPESMRRIASFHGRVIFPFQNFDTKPINLSKMEYGESVVIITSEGSQVALQYLGEINLEGDGEVDFSAENYAYKLDVGVHPAKRLY